SERAPARSRESCLTAGRLQLTGPASPANRLASEETKMRNPRITFVGAGSTVFMKNIVGDVLQREALRDARLALMDINPERLEESAVIAGKLIQTLGTGATVETFSDQRRALEGADFVVVCFQIGGYDPCTITDFEVP